MIKKAENYYVKIKLHKYPMSEKSDLYEFTIALFYKVKPEEFLLLMQSFKMMIEALWMLAANEKKKYICTLLCG